MGSSSSQGGWAASSSASSGPSASELGYAAGVALAQQDSASAERVEPVVVVDATPVAVPAADQAGSSSSSSSSQSQQQEVSVAGPSEIEPVVEDVARAPPAELGECVICLGELGSEDGPLSTLVCNHTFHKSCVDEWLSKDGRCPTCRRRIQEVAPPPERALPDLPAILGNAASLHSMTILMLDSRRLMMLATMEAALAVLVMSYIADLISPALMIIASSVTFAGASHYMAKSIGAARPILTINALYHVYLMAKIVHVHNGIPFFSDEYSTGRTILLSLGCVAVMEIATIKKATAFHQRLSRATHQELRTLRTSRRANVGWAQRLIVLLMFTLICAPVIARYVCGRTGMAPDGTQPMGYASEGEAVSSAEMSRMRSGMCER